MYLTDVPSAVSNIAPNIGKSESTYSSRYCLKCINKYKVIATDSKYSLIPSKLHLAIVSVTTSTTGCLLCEILRILKVHHRLNLQFGGSYR